MRSKIIIKKIKGRNLTIFLCEKEDFRETRFDKPQLLLLLLLLFVFDEEAEDDAVEFIVVVEVDRLGSGSETCLL